MPINLHLKFELKCKSGKTSTNKTKTVVIDTAKIACKYLSNTVLVLKPIIDSLIICYRFNDVPKHEHEELQTQIRSYLTIHDMDLHDEKYNSISFSDAKKPKYRGYKQNIYYTHSNGTKTLIQTDPKKDKLGKTSRPYLKLWVSPYKLGKEGIKELRELILNMTLQTISLDQVLAHENCAEQIDVAVDILGVAAEDLVIEGERNVESKSMGIHNPKGRLQTKYVDYKPGKSTRTYVYDKRAELIESGAEPMYDGVLHTRVEHRIKTKMPVTKWAKIKNHLKKIDLWAIDYSLLKPHHNFTHVLFIKYVILFKIFFVIS